MKIKKPISKIEHGNFRIKKNTLEWVFIVFLTLFSFLSTSTLLVSLFILLIFLRQREIGAIKIVNIITLRTIINPGIAVDIGNLQYLKWIILFGCSLYLLLSFNKLEKNEIKKIKWILSPLFLFVVYNIFVALVFSSLPIVSIFKLLSYAVIFSGILIGVGYTFKSYDWLKWMVTMFKLIIIFSFLIIPFPVSYLRNGSSFQGITNNPNMFGVLAVLFIAIFLSYFQINKNKQKLYSLISLFLSLVTLLMIFLSKSRTALISCLVLLFIYIIFVNCNKLLKIIIVNFSGIAVILIILGTNVINFLTEFLYKGQEKGNILYSRTNQIENSLSNFMDNPWFGNGFAVPVLPYKSYIFSAEFIVEPGNLVLSVLSYSGIFGFLLFLSYITRVFLVNKSNFKYSCFLPLATILISMGEMVFFSSNNIGIWCYMFIALYVLIDARKPVVNER
ncbi:hypothetical protein SRABI96_00377 [Peribacillus sp. Bi96]|uniref:O-antigen ligase family protein n=1 Tax=Peribacillus sp. Bi96 TaxID=2884273 RepID=UPI001D36E600|nr:O-antigen ligase family protein [Peribacillus sp. Bi96]CAH0136768.1 hypothetical protein SRABI96_00377 [Peribacillus sp. Bi96]